MLIFCTFGRMTYNYSETIAYIHSFPLEIENIMCKLSCSVAVVAYTRHVKHTSYGAYHVNCEYNALSLSRIHTCPKFHCPGMKKKKQFHTAIRSQKPQQIMCSANAGIEKTFTVETSLRHANSLYAGWSQSSIQQTVVVVFVVVLAVDDIATLSPSLLFSHTHKHTTWKHPIFVAFQPNHRNISL